MSQEGLLVYSWQGSSWVSLIWNEGSRGDFVTVRKVARCQEGIKKGCHCVYCLVWEVVYKMMSNAFGTWGFFGGMSLQEPKIVQLERGCKKMCRVKSV